MALGGTVSLLPSTLGGALLAAAAPCTAEQRHCTPGHSARSAFARCITQFKSSQASACPSLPFFKTKLMQKEMHQHPPA